MTDQQIIPTHSELRFENLARGMTVLGVIAAGWLFGGTEGWVYLLIALWLSVAGLFWLLSRLMASSCTIRAPGLLFMLLLWIGYGMLQVLPLNPSVVEVLNPVAGHVQADARKALEHIELPDEKPSSQGTLSVSPAATRRAVTLGFIYMLAFVLVLNTHREWEQIKVTAFVIVIVTSVMAVVAVVHAAMDVDRLLWIHAPRYSGRIFGPFSNRNHAAAYLNLACGLSLGLLLSAGRDFLRAAPGSRREAFRRMVHMYRFEYLPLLAFGLVVLVGTVCATLSRGGILSLCVGLGISALLVIRVGGLQSSRRYVLLGFAAVMILAITLMGWEPIVDRLLTLTTVAREHSGESRLAVDMDTIRMWVDAPLFGSGLGTFQHHFPHYSSRPLAERYLHAHNDWLQLLAEGGLIGALLAGLCVYVGVRALWRALRESRSRVRFLLVGLVLSISALAIHSCFDYALRRSGVMLLLVTVLGLALSAPYTEGGGSRSSSSPAAAPKRCVRPAALVIAVVLVLFLMTVLREWSGELSFIRLRYIDRWLAGTVNYENTGELVLHGLGEVEGVTGALRQNPESMRDAGSITLRWSQRPELTISLRHQLIQSAERCLGQSARQAPGNYLGWLWLARLYAIRGQWDAAEVLLNMARRNVRQGEAIRLFAPPPEAPPQHDWF